MESDSGNCRFCVAVSVNLEDLGRGFLNGGGHGVGSLDDIDVSGTSEIELVAISRSILATTDCIVKHGSTVIGKIATSKLRVFDNPFSCLTLELGSCGGRRRSDRNLRSRVASA